MENVSDVPLWLSDLLCRAVTGDGHIDRALYTDDDVSVLRFRRVLALNGISLAALKGDLADRFLPVELHVIDPTGRRGDEELHRATQAAVPGALGGLLELLVKVLRVLPEVRLAALPRMADFARVLAALDQVTGWSTLDTYLAGAGDLAGTVVDSDPFATALRTFLTERGTWTGSVTDLLAELPVPDPAPRRGWPTTAQGVSGELARCAPALRRLGFTIDRGERDSRTRRPVWYFAAPGAQPSGPQPERSAQLAFDSFATVGHRPERGPRPFFRTPPPRKRSPPAPVHRGPVCAICKVMGALVDKSFVQNLSMEGCAIHKVC